MSDFSGIGFSAPAQGAVAMTSATAYQALRAILVSVTVAANCTFTFGDGTTITIPLAVGTFQFNWAVTTWTLNSGTATAYGLK